MFEMGTHGHFGILARMLFGYWCVMAAVSPLAYLLWIVVIGWDAPQPRKPILMGKW
jgi:hypothetical protein